MNRRRRWISLLIGALLLLWSGLAGALSYYEPGPGGRLGFSRPTITQQLVLDTGESILRARMWINGVQVQPAWDEAGLVSYTPPEPLQSGLHTIRLSVEVSSGRSGLFYAPIVSEFQVIIEPGAIAELPLPGPEEAQALQFLNWIRAAAGLPLLSYSPALGAAAAGHAAYLTANPAQQMADAHSQIPETRGFFAVSAGERASYYGYAAGISEVINFVDRAEDAITGWIDTLYHRIPLLHPGMKVAGYGLATAGSDRVNVMMTGPADSSALRARWPYAGQTGVPTAWDGAEVPDPFVLYPGAPLPVGYPITLTFGSRLQGLTLNSFALTGPGGAVPVMSFHPGNDPHLTDTVALIPSAPLAASSTYTVRFAGSLDRGAGPEPFTEQWSFTTAPHHLPMPRSRVTTTTVDGTLRRVAVEGTGFGAGMKVYLGGLPVSELTIESAQRLTFTAPRGFFGGAADLVLVNASGAEAIWAAFFAGDEGFRFPSGPLAFAEVPVSVHGRPTDLPALLHLNGTLLLPEGVLESLGARAARVPQISRTYWTYAGQTGDYTLGRVSAGYAGQPFSLALPVQSRLGTAYVEAAFIRMIAGGSLLIQPDRIQVGMRDIGTHWSRPELLLLLQRGIVSGMGDGTFQPDGGLTRAAFVKMLVGAAGLGNRSDDPAGFTDTAGHWVVGQGYLAAAVQAGIVAPTDYPLRRFEPDRLISREEIAVMVVRALGREGEVYAKVIDNTGGLLKIGDRVFIDAASWSRAGHIMVAVENGIITGYQEADGRFSFRPTRSATRAEAVVMVVRAMKLWEEQAKTARR